MEKARTPPATGWVSRPIAARLLRALVFLAPFVASVAVVWVISRVIAAPDGTAGFIGWWVALSAVGSIVMFLVDRAARRLLPLAALLQLSLVFPDQAPSRFSAALKAGHVSELEQRLALMRRAARARTAAESAELLLTLVAALSAHDRITRGHSERVRAYSVMIGRELGLSEQEIDQLNWAALLHDVGKLEVPGEILNKPGRPSEEEWQQLRSHPLFGEDLVAPMRPWLGEWADAVGYHHERWDGKGYPRGVAGEEIPLPGRIVAIADVFDVITSARSYKDPGSPDEGREEIARCAGSQFDPRLVRAFLNVSLGRMRIVMGPLSWLAHLPIVGRVPLAPVTSSIWGAVGVAVATTATGIAGTAMPGPEAPVRASAAQPPALVAATRPKPPAERRAAAKASAARLPAGAPAAAPPLLPTPQTPAPEGARPSPPAAQELPLDELPRLTVEPQPATAAVPADGAPAVGSMPPIEPEPLVAVAPAPPVPNKAPSFTAGPDQVVLEDAGPKTVTEWATGISAGAFEGNQNVGFEAAAEDTSLFSVRPVISGAGTLTFTPAPDASGSTTVKVYIVDDGGTAYDGADRSAEQTFTITIGAVNDAPVYVPGSDQVAAEDSGPQTVAGWATEIAAGPADESSQDVAFSTANDRPGMFTAQPVLSPAGTLSYTPAPNANGTATVTVTAFDDGGTADGGEDSSAPQTFTITVSPVNDAPSFTAGADQTVVEDSGPATVTGWATAISAGPANESTQSVSFTATSDNPALFGAQPAVSPNGTLTYTPAAGEHGTATVTVRAIDDGGTDAGGVDASVARTFVITVVAPNRAPSFTAGAAPTVLEDSGVRTITGWATGISPGPSWESGQTVSFSVTSNNPGLFSAQPAISASGTLTFVPAANANGTATVTVRAVDDGGTAYGGSNTSSAQTVDITVLPVNDAPSFTGTSGALTIIDSSRQTIAGWATGISVGPANEAGQNVSFVVTNDNPGLFAEQPTVSPNGTLTYVPTFIGLGSATVTVRAVDDGGTSNGGADTSAPQTFTVTVIL